MSHSRGSRDLLIPDFLTPPDPYKMSPHETANALTEEAQRHGPFLSPVTARACELLRASANGPTDRQLTAAVLAFEHALPENEARPSSADRIVAMRAALLAAFREF